MIRPYGPGEETYMAEAQRRIHSEEYHWGAAFIDYAMDIAWTFAKKEKNPREEL